MNRAEEEAILNPSIHRIHSHIHKEDLDILESTGLIKPIRFFDCYAGIGGFRIGLERLGWKCVGFCEFNVKSVETYRANYDTTGEFYHSDATTLKTEKLPEFDVLCGGFPCQSFSLAGQRKGFEDTRGTLFFELARILNDRKPKAFIFENVKGLTLMSRNSNKGRDSKKIIGMPAEFDIIVDTCRQLGYTTFYKVLNSKNFGVPQNRERVFIVGFRSDIHPKDLFPGFQYPEGEPTKLRLKDILEALVPEKYYIEGKRVELFEKTGNIYPSGYSVGEVLNPEGQSPTIFPGESGGSIPHVEESKTGIVVAEGKLDGRDFNALSTEGVSKTVLDGHGFQIPKIQVVSVNSQTRETFQHTERKDSNSYAVRASRTPEVAEIEKIGEVMRDKGGRKDRMSNWNVYSDKGVSPTIIAGMGEGGGNVPMLPTPQKRIRRLTPRECLRLQGFPDTFKIVVSDTQIYKQAGNAVTTNVVEAVGKAMGRFL